MKQPTCDPCPFCIHSSTYSVRVGDCAYGNCMDEWDCDADVEWEGQQQGPCPAFQPILPSEYLIEQLWNEEEARWYKEGIEEDLVEGQRDV